MPHICGFIGQAFAAQTAGSLADIPLTEVPANSSLDLLAIHVTGDGGWGVTDRGIAEELAGRGIPVVGINALRYFWKPRTPGELTQDLSRVLRHYMEKWGKDRAILIGYSLGAEVLPFAVNQMSDELQRKIAVVVLLGPGARTDFRFRVTDWLTSHGGNFMVEPEIERIRGPQVVCAAGKSDPSAICGRLPSGRVKRITLDGGHRIGRRFEPIVDAIAEEIGVDRADASIGSR